MGGLAKGVTVTGSETLGFRFCLGLFFEALAAQLLEVTARGGVAVYGDFLTAVGDAVWPVLDEGFGARHGGKLEGRRCGCAGNDVVFVRDTERLMFEVGGMLDGMQQDMIVRENFIVW